jgi:putative tributyrin esterase
MNKLRRVELSDPRFENNHLRFITAKSAHLKGRGDICVFVPPCIDSTTPYPVVILLHGVYGSAWVWSQKAGVHLHALEMIKKGELPAMIIAMPSDGLWGDGSGYLLHNNRNFEKWIAEDVPELLQENISGVTADSPFFISGLSMGGFGSLKIGVKYSNKFKAVSGHSSITNLLQMKLFVEEDIGKYQQADKVDEDVFETIIRYSHHLPPIYFDCGDKDPLISYNRDLHTQLERRKIKHIFKEYPGCHEWPYWEKHIRESLLFFASHL